VIWLLLVRQRPWCCRGRMQPEWGFVAAAAAAVQQYPTVRVACDEAAAAVAAALVLLCCKGSTQTRWGL
jgi:hypothetical protein